MADKESSPGSVRVRFAPSPTGTLHVGSARTALYNFLFARHAGGSLVLRIEDTDAARSTREFEKSIMSDLAWLGLDWDEGPEAGGGFGPYRQSERSAEGIYRRAADELLDNGKAYYCFCSQERLDEMKQSCLDRGDMPKYDRTCEAIDFIDVENRIAAGEPATIRFRIPETEVTIKDLIHGDTTFSHEVLGDFIILRSDGAPSYNFAVVVDDIAMEITHVIRGEDHLTNTARQVLVFEALGGRTPEFAHHSLIMGPDGGKLSKRHGATSVGDFRAMGYLAPAIINYLALLSWSPGEEREKLNLAEMEAEFDIDRVSRSPAIFDVQKLDWLNGLYIRDLNHGDFHQATEPFLGDLGRRYSAGQLAVAEAAVQTSMTTLTDAPEQLEDFFTALPLAEAEGADEIKDPQAEAVLDMVLGMSDEVRAAGDFSANEVDEVVEMAKSLLKGLKAACKERDIPPKVLFRTLRIALTGKTSGPEVPFLLAGLGRDTVRERLEDARIFAAAR